MRGDRLPELRTTERELTMRLAFRESDRQSVEDLARVPVMLPDGSRIELGAVDHLFETGANDVMVVKGEREHLIPYIPDQFIVSVDFELGLVTVDWDADF